MSKALHRKSHQAAVSFAHDTQKRESERTPIGEPRRGTCGGKTPLEAGRNWVAHDGASARSRRLRQMARAEAAEIRKRLGVTVDVETGRTEAGLYVEPTRAAKQAKGEPLIVIP